MRILRIDPADASVGGGVVAHVDAQIGGVRLKQMVLKKTMRGEYRIYPQKVRGVSSADLDVGVARLLTEQAVKALAGGRFAHHVDHT